MNGLGEHGWNYITISTFGRPNKRSRVMFGYERGGHQKWKRERVQMNANRIRTKEMWLPFHFRELGALFVMDRWTLKVIYGVHNHPVLEYFKDHLYASRLWESDTSLIVNISKNRVRPRHIVNTKREGSQKCSTMKTIYNTRHKHGVLEKGGRSQMQ